MSELIDWNHSEVELLPVFEFSYLLLQLLASFPLLDLGNVLRVASHIAQQQLIELAPLIELRRGRDELFGDYLQVSFGESHVFADEGGDFDDAVLAGDGAHAGLDEGELVVF